MRAQDLDQNNLPQYLLVLSNNEAGVRKTAGSGFLISDEWAITAKHVLLEFFNVNWPGDQSNIKTKCSIVASSYDNDAKNSRIWEAFEAFSMNSSDMALLRLRLKHGSKIGMDFIPRINLKMLTQNDLVVGLGFPYSEIHIHENIVHWYAPGKMSKGRIKEIHSQKRDNSMVDYPSYQVETEFQPGMSGGPVIDRNGDIIGVVTTSFDESLSYFASIWPVYMYIDELKIHAKISNEKCVAIIRDRETNQLQGISYIN